MRTPESYAAERERAQDELRDHIAIAAMSGLFSNSSVKFPPVEEIPKIANYFYAFADAMLAARAVTRKGNPCKSETR